MAQVNYEINIGDIVQITAEGGHNIPIGEQVQVVDVSPSLRIFQIERLNIRPEARQFYREWVAGKQLEKITQTSKTTIMNITKQELKQAVEKVANDLMARDGNITTLFLLNECRAQFPLIYWNQYDNQGGTGVSNLFHELVREGKFKSVADNGTYQTYVPTSKISNTQLSKLSSALKNASANSTNPTISNTARSRGLVKGSATALSAGAKAAATRAKNKAANSGTVATTTTKAPATPVTGSVVRVGMAKARDLILNSKGIISATFTKQDGTERVLAGVVVKDQKEIGLGYILMKDLVKTKKEGKEVIRRANVQTLKSAKIKGVTYKVR